MEAELVGYEKGAFTGAFARRIGKFEEADEGIIFLDEIGELELSLQAKLLRILQEREIERLGNNRKIKVNFRLISSTNRDLKKAVSEGTFREDLLYRINVIDIKVPPLRERKEDIPLLVSAFVDEFCIRERKALTVTNDVVGIFRNHSWPGNVRQLRNVVERLVVLSHGSVISPHELSEEFSIPKKLKLAQNGIRTLKDVEMQALQDALHACNGNKSKACKVLGISRKAFYKRLKDQPPGGQGQQAESFMGLQGIRNGYRNKIRGDV
jgi:two-component system response regulator HydG